MYVCALHDFRNRKYVALFHWISNLCTQSNFAHVFAVGIDVVDFYCDFSISISINIFSLSAPDLHVCLSHFVFMSFILHSVFFSPYVALFFVWIYINESLIEQKITSVQSDACLKGGPLTKSSFPCLMQNWSELNEEQITATAAMIQTTTVNNDDDDDDDERVRPREGKKHIPHQFPFPSSIFFHCRNILILFLSASFAAGYERKLNNFQSNGYCNTTACIARWLKDADGIRTNLRWWMVCNKYDVNKRYRRQRRRRRRRRHRPPNIKGMS